MDIKRFFNRLGPGLLFASMAIGTSHLVLSTKAGAVYGMFMVIPILLANLLKYPFFEFGVRYTRVKEHSLTEGYAKTSKFYLWIYAGVNLVSAFTILAALYSVTAGMTLNIIGQGSGLSMQSMSVILFLLISLLIIIGKYAYLEKSLKYLVIILFIALLATVFLALGKGKVATTENFIAPDIFDQTGLLFLISLIGWMPTAVEASGWVSLWNLEKLKKHTEAPSLKETLREFNLGYFITALLAIFFFFLGFMTLYGTGTALSASGVVFAKELTEIFTAQLGNWARVLISISALAAMFSTCLSAHDALARVLVDMSQRLNWTKKNYFNVAVIGLSLSNLSVIIGFTSSMGKLVSIATFASFVFAPILGYMNHRLVFADDFQAKPSMSMKVLSYIGIIFLGGFSVYYLISLF